VRFVPERAIDWAEKLALFQAWDGLCVWCRLPLPFLQTEVEHLVPKGLSQDKLAATLELYGLEPTYDVWATENLAPSCGPCNRRKGRRPPPDAPLIRILLRTAAEQAPTVRKRAKALHTDRALEIHIAAILAAAETAPTNLTPLQAKVAQVVRDAFGFLTLASHASNLRSRYVTETEIRYTHRTERTESVRRLWLVDVPEHRPLAVVIEGPGEEGWYIQNAAETLAMQVAREHDNRTTVLHYVDEKGPWGDFWMPIPFIDGTPTFGESLLDHPEVLASLRAAGLLLRDQRSDIWG
jgi:5-methylcytosine-specific restriction endonuclease McrA